MAKTSPARSAAKFILPDLPREKWCDFRVGYSEHNKTLVQLAEEYMCDPRTVRSCLLRNKPSSSLGKKTVPTQIDLYRDEIQEALEKAKAEKAKAKAEKEQAKAHETTTEDAEDEGLSEEEYAELEHELAKEFGEVIA